MDKFTIPACLYMGSLHFRKNGKKNLDHFWRVRPLKQIMADRGAVDGCSRVKSIGAGPYHSCQLSVSTSLIKSEINAKLTKKKLQVVWKLMYMHICLKTIYSQNSRLFPRLFYSRLFPSYLIIQLGYHWIILNQSL